MGFFRRRDTSGEPRHPQFPSLGSGRRLRSTLASTDCLAHLEALLFSYRPPKSAYRTPYVVPGWRWNGPQHEKPPETVILFSDSNDTILYAAFWPDSSGTECGLFPLGSGDERLSALPIIGHWKQRDASLTSIGVFPPGLIIQAPPRVADQFVEEILKTAGFPSTPRNIEKLGMKIGQMYLAEANKFIASQDPRSADRFIQNHHYTGGPLREFCQRVLDDVAAWNPGVLPYIQDTPMMVRAISLEALNAPESMWNEIERSEIAANPQQVHNSPAAWVDTGIAHSDAGRHTEALVAYDRALELNPTYPTAHAFKALALARLRRYEEALAACERALQLNPSEGRFYALKGNVLTDLQRYEEALAALDQALVLAPDLLDAWLGKGIALIGLGRFEEALAASDHTITLDSNNSFAWRTKAAILRELGRTAEAAVAERRVQELGG